MQIRTEKKTWEAQIVRFRDGDTVILMIDLGWGIFTRRAIRLVGIESWELNGTNHAEALAARAAADKMFAGLPARLLPAIRGDDRYGRVRAHVLTNAGDLADLLCAAGLSWRVDRKTGENIAPARPPCPKQPHVTSMLPPLCHPPAHHPAALIVTLITTLIVGALVTSTGCAVRGERRTDAEAIDESFAGTPALRPPPQSTRRTRWPVTPVSRYRYRHTTTGTQPPTARQRVAAIVGNFSGVALVGLIAALILIPGTVIAFAGRQFLRTRAALRETVVGIKTAEAAGHAETVKPYLAVAQSNTTKAIVSRVKHAA